MKNKTYKQKLFEQIKIEETKQPAYAQLDKTKRQIETVNDPCLIESLNNAQFIVPLVVVLDEYSDEENYIVSLNFWRDGASVESIVLMTEDSKAAWDVAGNLSDMLDVNLLFLDVDGVYNL